MEILFMEPLTDPFAILHARRFAVFGHPTHELAILGLLQRYRPHVLVITDGGGESLIAQSRRGRLLQDQGAFQKFITYRDHFLPMAEHLQKKTTVAC